MIHQAFETLTPNMWPVYGEVSSGFGWRESPENIGSSYHEGIDIATDYNVPVKVTADGVVTVRDGKTATATWWKCAMPTASSRGTAIIRPSSLRKDSRCAPEIRWPWREARETARGRILIMKCG